MKPSPQTYKDGLFVFAICILTYFIAGHFDLLERIVQFSKKHEAYELDEIITVMGALAFGLLFFSIRRLHESNKAYGEAQARRRELERALEEIQQLRGIIPICAYCKNVRDDQGYWQKVESYVEKHSRAEFSHGICPDCMQKYYPDFQDNDESGD